MVGLGFYWIEVFALYVFDEGDFELSFFRKFLYHDRHSGESREPRGARSPFSGYDEIGSVSGVLDDDRLDYSVFADRVRQFLEGLFVEFAPGLMGIRFEKRGINKKFRACSGGVLA